MRYAGVEFELMQVWPVHANSEVTLDNCNCALHAYRCMSPWYCLSPTGGRSSRQGCAGDLRVANLIVEQVLKRAADAKSESDFTYFFSLLLAAEAIAKVAVCGLVATINDDRDRHRYRLEHTLVRADGLGGWAQVLDDALVGPASQFLDVNARNAQKELTMLCKAGEWQHECVSRLASAMTKLGLSVEEVPVKSDLRRWFRLLAVLRNKTRAHGATTPGRAQDAISDLASSVELLAKKFCLFNFQWAYLHRNLSGKYRVSPIADAADSFSYLGRQNTETLSDGVYVFAGRPRRLNLIVADSDLRDFFIANGGYGSKDYELLSYFTDNKAFGDAGAYLTPPGLLPESETAGTIELQVKGECFTNVPGPNSDYIARPKLEQELHGLLIDDRRPIVTLVGRGGIGKTSLAIQVIGEVIASGRYDVVVWFSARDVDLASTGPKAVRPSIVSREDIAEYYAGLAYTGSTRPKGATARIEFERQLQKCDLGRALFVFDNFETTDNPIELFGWLDTFIRLPNKILITTRLREFKGDYPVTVSGMTDAEAAALIAQSSLHLNITDLITEKYRRSLIEESSGHPYVIKILLGEVARHQQLRDIPRIVAGSEEILTTLFERTYSALSPCAQRAFLTMSAWNSAVPRVALEAVLIKTVGERTEVEEGIESLVQYSLAETIVDSAGRDTFIALPLVASVFGKKKLNVSPLKAAIQSDTELLRMLGPTKVSDASMGLSRLMSTFLANISKRLDQGQSYGEYRDILEMICRSYLPGWLLLARWHIESGTLESLDAAKDALGRYLEEDPTSASAGEAWRLRANLCYRTGDVLGEITSFIERAQIASTPFYDLSGTANRLNALLRDRALIVDSDERKKLVERLLQVMDRRRGEADADDLSRMAWLSMHIGEDDRATVFVRAGLTKDPDNYHCQNLGERLGI